MNSLDVQSSHTRSGIRNQICRRPSAFIPAILIPLSPMSIFLCLVSVRFGIFKQICNYLRHCYHSKVLAWTDSDQLNFLFRIWLGKCNFVRDREKLRYEAGCVTLPFPTTDSAGRQATSTLTTSQVPLEYSLNEMGEDHYFHHPSNMSIE